MMTLLSSNSKLAGTLETCPQNRRRRRSTSIELSRSAPLRPLGSPTLEWRASCPRSSEPRRGRRAAAHHSRSPRPEPYRRRRQGEATASWSYVLSRNLQLGCSIAQAARRYGSQPVPTGPIGQARGREGERASSNGTDIASHARSTATRQTTTRTSRSSSARRTKRSSPRS